MSPQLTTTLQHAAAALDAGRTVAVPTETVYGLAARIDRHQALRAVFELKQRPLFDPLIVHIASVAQARTLVTAWPAAAAALAERFWPGPLSIVLPKADAVDPLITAGLDTVALRCPDHPLTRALIERTGPLAAPSANRFGRTSPTTAAHVAGEFPDADLLILDGGACEQGIESTVVRLLPSPGAKDADPHARVHLDVLRPGLITAEDLAEILRAASIAHTITTAEAGTSDPGGSSRRSPGMLDRHYQPGKPVVIVRSAADVDPLVLRSAAIDALRARTDGSAGAVPLDPADVVELALDPSPAIAARTLYADLRRIADDPQTRAIVVRHTASHSGGAWDAVWDRLSRCASAVVDVR